MRKKSIHLKFILGILTGIIGTVAVASVAGWASDIDKGHGSFTVGMLAGNCTLRFGQRRLTNAPRCYEGEVVTGIMTTSYYCSQLIIDCGQPEN